MKKIYHYLLATFVFGGTFISLNAAETHPKINKSVQPNVKNPSYSSQQVQREEYNILNRDQIDTTSTLAIPFDDSEIEDEQEINRDEKREVFPLPHSPR